MKTLNQIIDKLLKTDIKQEQKYNIWHDIENEKIKNMTDSQYQQYIESPYVANFLKKKSKKNKFKNKIMLIMILVALILAVSAIIYFLPFLMVK